MLRQNPNRFIDYVVTCAMGEDLYHMRQVVRDKVAAIIMEQKIEVPATQSLRGAALQGRLSEAPLEPSSSGAPCLGYPGKESYVKNCLTARK
jgi:hypothetical protein